MDRKINSEKLYLTFHLVDLHRCIYKLSGFIIYQTTETKNPEVIFRVKLCFI